MSGKILVEMPIPEICHIIMNRPEKHNALDREAYRLLTDALQNADENENIRVIVLSGAGKCFTAGNDLHDFTGESLLDGKGQSPGLKLLLTLHGMNKPVIAAVEGYAVGIGATMLNHCDLAYCGTSARFDFRLQLWGYLRKVDRHSISRLRQATKRQPNCCFSEISSVRRMPYSSIF